MRSSHSSYDSISLLILLCPALYFSIAAFSLRQAVLVLLDFTPTSKPANKAADTAAANDASAIVVGVAKNTCGEVEFIESTVAATYTERHHCVLFE